MFKCNYGLSNTGIDCFPLLRALKKIILVPYYDNAGDINTVDTTQTLDQAFFEALRDEDIDKRWLPLPGMQNVTNERAESQKETFDSGTAVIIQQAMRKFSGIIVDKDASPVLLGKLEAVRQVDAGFYGIDKDNNLIGMMDEATNTNLNPIRIDSNTWDAIFNPATDKATQKLSIMFDVHVDEMDRDLRVITSAEMGGYRIANLKGLRDVDAVFSNLVHTTGFTVQLNTNFGTIINPVTVKGLVIGDFVLKNRTTPATITVTSVTEQTDANGKPTGVYDFVIPAQSASDAIQLIPTLAGFDFATVIAAAPVLV